MNALVRQQLPVAAPARVLACGAWLKNTACLLDGDTVWMSPLHGDLGTPEARASLLESVARLQLQASGPIEAVAHDLHPDFFSTEVAQQLAQRVFEEERVALPEAVERAAHWLRHGGTRPILGNAIEPRAGI